MAKRRRKPFDPAAAAERAALARADRRAREAHPDRWGEDPLTQSELAAHARQGANVALDLRGRIRHAHRADWIGQLSERDQLTREQTAALRRLEEDMIERAGNGGGGEAIVRYAAQGAVIESQGDACAVTDRMVEAGRRVDAALTLVGPPSSRLLHALLMPGVEGLRVNWRGMVQKITGEKFDATQAAVVRYAAQALADVYPQVDRDLRARREDRRDLSRAG